MRTIDHYPVIEREIKAMFCLGMSDETHSYAGGGKPTTIDERRGLKGFKWISKDGEYVIDDQWTTHPSSGLTFDEIYVRRNKVPVLIITMSGWYDPAAIPCLKEALLQNYKNGTFHFGRGPGGWIKSGMRYTIQEFKDNRVPSYVSCAYERIEKVRGAKLLGEHFITLNYMSIARPMRLETGE